MISVKDKQFVPLIGEQQLMERIDKVAESISNDYRDKNPLFVVILNGAFLFAAEVFKRLDIECEITFTRLASYIKTSSSGKVTMLMELPDNVTGRHVVIVEDIVDTGRTLAEFLPHLQLKKPASVRIASLLTKPTALKENIEVHYLGFAIEDKFVVGFGLDYDEAGRNIRGIYQLSE